MSNQSFKVKSGLTLTPVDLATLTNPQAGDLACDINDSNKIKRYDALTSAWAEVGSGGVGSVDIMFVQDFESASLATFVSPTDVTLSQTDPLHGKVSALLTHDASVNKSFKQIIPVDRKFRGQAMVLDLNVKSAASAGNVTIKITDETGSVDLIASEQLQLSNDVSGRRSSISFTIPSTCASLSYTITALPEAGSPVTRIDDIVAMLSDVSLLETSVLVPNMTAWQGYTPTFQGFGSPTNIEFEWRQVGENVEIRGKFTAGTTTAVEAQIGLPAGLTSAGTSLIPSIQIVGSAGFSLNSLTITPAILIEPSKQYMTIGYSQSTNAALTKQTGTAVMSSGNSLSLFASVPCAGLSATTTRTIPLTQSGLVQEADSYIRLSGSTIDGSLRVTSPTVVTNIGDDFIVDTSAGYVKLKAAQEGVYTITFIGDGTSSGLDRQANILLNGSSLSTQRDIGNGAGEGFSLTNTISRYLLTTDELTFTISGSSARTYSIQASYQGSLKQVSVSSDQKITIPTSELRFEGASSRGSTATAIVKFDTMTKLRGDAFTVESDAVLGTRITMNKAGKLDINANLYLAGASSLAITRNQSNLTISTTSPASELLSAQGTNSTANRASASWSGFVNVGDIIRVATETAVSSFVTNSLNFSFQEQDISVSVTNTLPQFSESDSSVRVDTANGYGSTGTKIRRFSNVRENIGTDITYNPNGDEAINGASFRVNSAGIYNISYSDSNSSANGQIGITLNSSNLATNISTLQGNANNEVLASQDRATTASANFTVNASWQGYLNAGDVIRPHTDGGAVPSNNLVKFTISKVGKPNVTGVDVTPFVNVPQPDTEFLSATGGSGANAIVSNFSGLSSTSKGIISQTSSRLTALKTCNFSLFVRATSGGAGNRIDIYKNGSLYVTGITIGSGSMLNQVSLLANIGDYFEVYSLGAGGNTGISYEANAEATSDTILTAPETFSTDTAALQYSSTYTLSTLQNAPVGTYITFTYAANTNTRTQTTTRPTQTDADMNANGLLVYTRAYNAASTAAQPAAFAIQIGKGLKGKSLDLYKSAGKVTNGSIDLTNIANTVQRGLGYKEYNEITGILLIDAGVNFSSANTDNNFQFNDLTSQTSGYLVINASKNPALTGLNVLLPRIATLSDVKPSGTAGGTATSGSYQTRTLNTISDPTGIVTSLVTNQFTLPAGEYYIEASAPACFVATHKAKIRNITDAIDAVIGTSEVMQAATTSEIQTRSTISGSVTLSSSKTFELQHRVATTRATDGFGQECAFGDNEVYSIVKITKVK